MPEGKPAGVRCLNLNEDNLCSVYKNRPEVCAAYTPTREICGNSFKEAKANITLLEHKTT